MIFGVQKTSANFVWCGSLSTGSETPPSCVTPRPLRSPLPFPESSHVSLDSQHPDALARIQTLESRADAAANAAAASGETEAVSAAPPAFTEHMTDVRCAEGEDIALECRVTPANDPRLQIGELGRQMIS